MGFVLVKGQIDLWILWCLLQQLQRLHAAQEPAGGALTLTLQQSGGGVGPQLVLAPQGFISGGASATEHHVLHHATSSSSSSSLSQHQHQIGGQQHQHHHHHHHHQHHHQQTTSIQHVLQSSISHHVHRHASILQSSIHPIPVSTHQSSQVSGSDVQLVGAECKPQAVVSDAASPIGVAPSSPFSPQTPQSPTTVTVVQQQQQQHHQLQQQLQQQQQHQLQQLQQQQQHIVQAAAAAAAAAVPTHHHHSVLQLFHQQATTRNTIQSAGATIAQNAIKTKLPPQILPKPVGSTPLATSVGTKPAHTTSTQVNTMPQHQGALLLNQMLPNGAVLVQQQTSSGVQLILKSPPPAPQAKQGLVIANGGLQPQAVIVQGRTQAHQVLRLVPGQMQLQQIQTSSGPTFIAVPSQATAVQTQPQAQPRATPPPPQQQPLQLQSQQQQLVASNQHHHPQHHHHQMTAAALIAHKKAKKKKKKEEEPRLDLANLIKISEHVSALGATVGDHSTSVESLRLKMASKRRNMFYKNKKQETTEIGIDEEDSAPIVVSHGGTNATVQQQVSVGGGVSTQQVVVNKSTTTSMSTSTISHHQQSQPQLQQVIKQQQLQQQQQSAPVKPSQLLAQLQSPAQVGTTGLRLSVGEDGTMVVHQTEQPPTVTPSIAAAAQSQLAQLIADHGGQILQANTTGLANSASKEAAFMQSLQTAVLQLTGTGTDGVVLKSNLNSTPVVLNTTGIRRASTGSVVMAPQNGVRLVTDLNGSAAAAAAGAAPAVSLTEHNRLIVSGLTPALLTEQNRLQIVTGVPTSHAAALSLEQQNRIIVSGVATTTTPNAMLSQQQNRVIVSNMGPEQSRGHGILVAAGLEDQNRVQIASAAAAMSLTEQNRVIVSDVSLDQQNKLQLLSGSLAVSGLQQNTLTEQQNRVIVSGVQNSNVSLEQQNRVQILSGGGQTSLEHQNKVQIVSGVQSSVTEQQNRVQIVSGVPSSNTLALSEQNRLQIVSNVPNTLSLTEKQNLVQIVNSNISLSEQQNRVQIITTMPSSVLSDQGRLRIINTESGHPHLTLHDSNRVQVVTSIPSVVDHGRIQIVTSVPSSVDTSRTEPMVVRGGLSDKLHIVNSDLSNKVHLVSSGETYSDHRKLRDEQGNNVQVVSALLNGDKFQNEQIVRTTGREGTMQPPAFRVQQYLRPADLRLIAGVQKEKEDKEEKKVVDDTSRFNEEVLPRVQIVGANNHTTVISRGHTEGASPPKQKSPAHFQSPVGSPPPSATPFNNRPHLTVVTQPQRYQPPATPPFSQSVATQASKAESSPPKATPPCPVAAANRRTYDNAFLDSIAQAHPSLVINKSPTGGAPTICAKLQVKTKKPMMKKAAVVKPMMAEDRCDRAVEDQQQQHPPLHQAPAPQPPPSLAPISVTATSASPDHTVVSRVQTIQLTPQKQQQLKQIQAQVQVLSSNKCRSPSEQATLQKLISEQHKILIGGKLIPTIPGQHAQGLAFVSSGTGSPPVRLISPGPPRMANAGQQTQAPPPAAPPPPPVPPPPSVAPPVESQHHHQPPPPPQQQQPTVIHHQHHQAHHTSTANKATSPIHIQQVSTQTPVHSAPPQPIFTRAKRASLIEQQMQADRQGAVAPDTDSPFVSKSDAVKRLIRYHTMNEPVLSEKDLAKADEIFEQTAKHLLDKKTHMYNKYTFLILKESMRLQQTSELVLLERLFVADETSRLEQFKQDMTAPVQQSSPPSAQHQHPSLNAGQSSVVKRERDEFDAIENKKHCPDDEEINAQVQSAIDSILNLQRNDPLDDAVRGVAPAGPPPPSS